MTERAKERRRGGWLPPRSGGYHGFDEDSAEGVPAPPPGPSGVSGVSTPKSAQRKAS